MGRKREAGSRVSNQSNIQPHKGTTRECATKTHIHGSDVILVGFPDLLHDLQLGPAAALNGAFDRDGPLWVVQRQVLKAAQPPRESGERDLDCASGFL